MPEHTDDTEVFVYTDEELAEIQARYDTAIRALYDTTTPGPDEVAHIPLHEPSTPAQLCSDAANLAEALAADCPQGAVETILCHNDLGGLVFALALLVNEAADARSWVQLQEQVWQDREPVIPERLATLGWANHRPVVSESAVEYGPGHPDFEADLEAEWKRETEIREQVLADLTYVEAIDVLSRDRHALPNDALRSLQSILFCASAARFGEPYEDDLMSAEDYAAHNTAECEDENGHPERGPEHLMEQFRDETGLLDFYRGDPGAIDETEDVQPFLAWIAADTDRAAAWAAIGERYGRSDRELIAGVVKQHAPLF